MTMTGTSRAEGKKRATGIRTVELRCRRKIEHPDGLAPRFEVFGATIGPGSRVLHVADGSPAARCHLRMFDRIVKVDGEPLTRDFDLAIQYSKELHLQVERPGSGLFEDIALQVGDREWITAIMAVLGGDEVALQNAAREIEEQSRVTAPLAERRLTEEDVLAVGMRVMAATGQQMDSPLPPGCLLVEVALEMGHRHIVQMLLEGATRAGYVPPSHCGAAASSSAASSWSSVQF